MSTPLSTMAVIVADLRESGEGAPADWKQSIELLWGQIEICRHSLEEITRSADLRQPGKNGSAVAGSLPLATDPIQRER